MAFLLIIVPVLLLAVVVIALVRMRSWGQQRVARDHDLAGPAATLDYVVPPGQDPALVVSALRQDGYEAAPDPRRTDVLHIECPAGPDRERPRVRATLQSVRRTAIDTGAPMDPGPVRFVDEAEASR